MAMSSFPNFRSVRLGVDSVISAKAGIQRREELEMDSGFRPPENGGFAGMTRLLISAIQKQHVIPAKAGIQFLSSCT
jgi:hypothetical protein